MEQIRVEKLIQQELYLKAQPIIGKLYQKIYVELQVVVRYIHLQPLLLVLHQVFRLHRKPISIALANLQELLR